MRIPFTIEQFLGVFRAYNEAIWPAQLLLLGLALLGLVLVARPRPWSHAALSGILALLWMWQALAYHVAFFAGINPLAYAFAVLALIGAGVFLWEGVIRRRLRFAWGRSRRSWLGMALVGFSLLVYPAWSWIAGHGYPYMPTFGVPCPTALYTVGMLAFLVAPFPWTPLVVPMLWSAIGLQAAFLLDVPQDLSLLGAVLVGIYLLTCTGINKTH